MIEDDFDDDRYIATMGMKMFGGNFVKSLASALCHADYKNARIIKNSFPEIWAHHKKLYLKHQERLGIKDGRIQQDHA